MRLDPRFAGNPLVTGEPGLRFYAGAPLMLSGGTAAGSLCLVDFQPRTFSPSEQATLQDLAAGVVSELELRRALIASAQSEALYRQMFADSPYPMWVFDAETRRFLDVNEAALVFYGYNREEFLALTVFDIRPPEDRPLLEAHLRQQPSLGPNDVNRGIWRHQAKNGTQYCMEIAAHSVQHGGRSARMILAQDVTERCRTETALRQSEQKFARHIQQTPLAAIEMDPDMTILSWNPAAERTFGYTEAEAVGQNVMRLIVPEEVQPHVAQIRAGILSGTGGTRSTNYNRTKSGTLILCEWYNTPLTDDAGRSIGCASLARDITEDANAQERLRRSEAHKAAILDSALDCIISIDRHGCVVDWNPAAERTFGWLSAEVVGQAIADIILPPPLRLSYHQGLLYYLHSGEWPAFHSRVELPVQRRDGTGFQAELTATALQTDSAEHSQCLYTIYLRDVSERKAMEREREELLGQTEALLAEALERADHDPLTGLLNHRAFHKRLKEDVDAARLSGRRGAALLVDVDNFKFFNDAYGHLAGDDVLRRLAQAFGSTCRAGDTLARFGGDEFALLLPDVTYAEAEARAAELRGAAALAGYHPPGYETPIPFSLSVGIACFPEDAATRTALLEAADARLRVSKSGGDADSHAQTVRRSLARSVGGFTMLDALVTAVDNKDRYTRRHSEDVMHCCLQIAQRLGLDPDAQRVLEVAALLHDVGKIGVPDAILRKPGRLTEGEYEAVQQHPLMGSVIVGAVPGFEGTLDAVRHHHERWDGGGYPFGLAGEETPLSARIMAVADAFSAMTTDRPYRKGMAPDKALSILEAGAGTQWDPACVQAFLQARRA